MFVAPGSARPDTKAGEQDASESKGLPPRAAANEYLSQGQAGSVTIGAEFVGHSVPTREATYSSEDYIVVEAGLFGPARTKLAATDFSLRVNGKKTVLPNQPSELVFRSLKDPEWEPTKKEKSKGSLSTGGGGGGDQDATPEVVHMPIELKRAMEANVRKSVMPEGDRMLPQAGLLFFEYRGRTQGIRSLELVYSGAAGNATIRLQP
jgi:hypothetical protein